MVNKIIVGTVAIVIILVAAFSFFAFANVDMTFNVNSAFYTDNIINKTPTNGQFLIMNVSVKNNGQDTLTVSNDQFTPMINGKPVEKYSVYTGDGTDLERQIQIPSGENKTLLVIFDIGDQNPDSIEYHGPISWASTYKTSTTVNTITPGVPFAGMNQTATTNMEMNGTVMGINLNAKFNGTDNEFFEKTDVENLIKETSTESSTSNTSTTGVTSETNVNTAIVNLTTGLYTNGSATSALPKNLTKDGDSITIKDQKYTIIGSEVIDILGHKIECWKVESTYEYEGSQMKAIIYYDKTTRMSLKMVIEKQNTTISGYTFQMQGNGEITSTNMPLIGIA